MLALAHLGAGLLLLSKCDPVTADALARMVERDADLLAQIVCLAANLSSIRCGKGYVVATEFRRVQLVVAIVLVSGCTAGYHADEVGNSNAERVTVGTVQKEIRVGMSAADVASVMGTPNIVTTDEQRREVWIYDKVATEVRYSTSSGGVAGLIVGGSGGGIGGAGRSAGAASSSQRTLTVIIKFDEESMVRDFSYRTSQF